MDCTVFTYVCIKMTRVLPLKAIQMWSSSAWLCPAIDNVFDDNDDDDKVGLHNPLRYEHITHMDGFYGKYSPESDNSTRKAYLFYLSVF